MTRILKNRWMDFVVFGVYACVTLWTLFAHEPWSDEAQPWLIARDASLPTFFQLMLNNYDRHPFVWYAVLLPFAKAGLPYLTMQIIHWLFAIATVLFFILRAPFSKLLRYLFVFSYLMMFEYVIVARHYIIALFLIFLIADLYSDRFKKPVVFSLLIAILPNTSYMAFGLCVGLLIVYLFELVRNKNIHQSHIIAALIMAFGIAIAIAQAGFLPENHLNYGYVPEYHFENALRFIARAFIPASMDISDVIAQAAAIFILTVTLLAFLEFPHILFIFLIGVLFLSYVFISFHRGELRHHGFLIVFLIFSLWTTQKMRKATGKKGRFCHEARHALIIALGVCFAISIKYTFHTHFMEHHFLFSGASVAAEHLDHFFDNLPRKTNLKPEEVILVSPNTSTSGVLPYLPKQLIWDPCLKAFRTYYINWADIKSCQEMDPEEIVRQAFETFGRLDPVFILLSQKTQLSENSPFSLHPLLEVDRGIWGYMREKFYLYKPILKQKP